MSLVRNDSGVGIAVLLQYQQINHSPGDEKSPGETVYSAKRDSAFLISSSVGRRLGRVFSMAKESYLEPA